MSTDPAAPPEPEVLPSSTPDGPQVIPTHGTPPGEPGPDPVSAGFGAPVDTRDSNPNGAGPQGLAGDIGVSSERTGPAGDQPRDLPAVEGAMLGSRGGAVTSTDGTNDVSPGRFEAPDVSRLPTGGDAAGGEPRPAPLAEEKNRR